MTEEQQKHYLVGIANLYLSGLSLRDIAKFNDKSHVSIRRDLTVILRRYDITLWQTVTDAMEDRQPDSLKKESVKNRVIEVIKLYLKKDKTVVQIAEELNSTEFVIYRDLVLRAPQINDYENGAVSKEDLIAIKQILTEHKEANLLNVSESRRK